MNSDKMTPDPGIPEAEEVGSDLPKHRSSTGELKGIARIWEGLVRLGLGESTLRVVTSVVSISLFLIVLWIMGNFYIKVKANGKLPFSLNQQSSQKTITPSLTSQVVITLPSLSITPGIDVNGGISRLADLHTILPSRPRFEVITYTVQPGDSIYGIAEKFNLKPATIMWGNINNLSGNPDLIQPGIELNILPVNGAYHEWVAGEGLNAISKYYGVTPDDIINWPGNHLSADTIGDLSNPNIKPGTMIVIPGGTAEFIDYIPIIPRDNPAVAYIGGTGSCGPISSGATGTGTFVWPTALHYLSGYHYDPSINHFGIDAAGILGSAIYATDGGVIVYAGWNDLGYGNMIIIDHGTGWQSLYGHLSEIDVVCGQSVAQGDTIGLMGSTGNSTGPHLHFEVRNSEGGRVDPNLLFINP
jgi:LysM repeat protein